MILTDALTFAEGDCAVLVCALGCWAVVVEPVPTFGACCAWLLVEGAGLPVWVCVAGDVGVDCACAGVALEAGAWKAVVLPPVLLGGADWLVVFVAAGEDWLCAEFAGVDVCEVDEGVVVVEVVVVALGWLGVAAGVLVVAGMLVLELVDGDWANAAVPSTRPRAVVSRSLFIAFSSLEIFNADSTLIADAGSELAGKNGKLG